MKKHNPKSLNLENLEDKETKVTLGFKCNPHLKLKLALDAQKQNFTLSEYVESIINREEYKTYIINDLRTRLAFYENDFMQNLFEKYEGITLTYKNTKEEQVNLEIKSIQDMFTVFTESYRK